MVGRFEDDTFKKIRAYGPAQLTYQPKVKIWDNFGNFWLIGREFGIGPFYMAALK